MSALIAVLLVGAAAASPPAAFDNFAGVVLEPLVDVAVAGPPPPAVAVTFDATLDDFAVLQQTPSDAFVYGTCTTDNTITVKVSGAGCPSLAVIATVSNHTWKAKVPGAKGGDCTILATDEKGNSANLTHVTYGDVWYCGGQSNMALPMAHTFSRNVTAKAVLAGKYSNIRIKQIASNMNPDIKWMTLHAAVAGNAPRRHNTPVSTFLETFSAACYYFGESLTEELGADAPPLGLVHTAYGGSMIEQWLPEDTVKSCKNTSNYTAVGGGKWWQARILPFSQMTLKGWTWYQGENNMHAPFGNSKLGTGYACMMPKLVAVWRALWSTNSGTDPEAPFGVVTLAASGGEGGADIGSMRLAQTGSYGVLPNPIMPNTFLAQAGDLDDPVSTLNCYHSGCCTNSTKSPSCSTGIGCDKICHGGSVPDYSWEDTPVYMGPIHPRDKKPVGNRLARAAASLVYKKAGAYTGPTITGCAVSSDKKTVVVTFNASLFAGDSLEVQDYTKSNTSQMSVLVHAGKFCFQTGGGRGPAVCLDDGYGNFNTTGPINEGTDWQAVALKLGSEPNTVEVDLSETNGVAFGLRYGWQGGGDGCAGYKGPQAFCEPASAPLRLKTSRLPANPFMVKIEGGKCKCMPPQVCDE